MKVTTQDIIKALPFEDIFKRSLLQQFDKLNPGRKFIIEQTLWDTYDALFQLKVEEKMQLAFDRAKRNEETLDETFYKRIKDEAEKEMEKGFFQNTKESDLSAIRSKLQTLMTQN